MRTLSSACRHRCQTLGAGILDLELEDLLKLAGAPPQPHLHIQLHILKLWFHNCMIKYR